MQLTAAVTHRCHRFDTPVLHSTIYLSPPPPTIQQTIIIIMTTTIQCISKQYLQHVSIKFGITYLAGFAKISTTTTVNGTTIICGQNNNRIKKTRTMRKTYDTNKVKITFYEEIPPGRIKNVSDNGVDAIPTELPPENRLFLPSRWHVGWHGQTGRGGIERIKRFERSSSTTGIYL